MIEPKHAHIEPGAGNGFRVEGLWVDPASGRIEGPRAAEQVDPKVMEVFVALARRPGRVITRDELLDAIWPGNVVTDYVLSRCIYQLRKHLVRAGGSRKYKALLETLPKRGYRLNAEVVPNEANSEAVPRRKAAAWPRVGLLAVLLAGIAAWWAWDWTGDGSAPEAHAHLPVSIAVLPFVDLSAEGDQEYFADGITEELINVLARLPDLRVIARSSSFFFKDQHPDIAEVAEKLNVTHVLEGSVRRFGDRVRITAQLIDAADSLHLWSETFEREFGDIFAIQDEIAVAVAENLELAFRGNDSGPAAHTSDPEAYALNLHGWFLFNRRLPGDLDHAEGYYRRALEIDPEYAVAWAGLSGVYFIQAVVGERDFDQALALAREAAERAVELDPTLPEARARLGRVLEWMGERDAAAVHMEKAVEYGRDSPLVLSMQAGYAWFRRDFDEAIELDRRAVELDPLNFVYRENLAVHSLSAGRFEGAEREIRIALEIRPEVDSWGPSSRLLANALILQRKPDEALALIEHWPEGGQRDRALALIHAIDGQRALFDAALARLAARADLDAAMALADVFAITGDADAAFGWLDVARQQFEAEKIDDPYEFRRLRIYLRTSPFLDPLRADSRWQGWLVDPMRELPVQPADG